MVIGRRRRFFPVKRGEEVSLLSWKIHFSQLDTVSLILCSYVNHAFYEFGLIRAQIFAPDYRLDVSKVYVGIARIFIRTYGTLEPISKGNP
jgi:hypothetical protein